MSRPTDRANRAHLVAVPDLRSPQSHLRSIRSWLGKQAAIGGRSYVARIIKSDAFAARLLTGLDAETRMAALESAMRIMAAAPEKPVPYAPASKNDRVKIKWTDDIRARFLREAPRSKDDLDLARRLGLPPMCRHALRRERCRHGILRGASTTKTKSGQGTPLAAVTALAA